MATNLVPYVFFYGRCEEALEFYKSVFGGKYEMMRVSDTPMASEMPPEAQNSVMHASFTADAVAFMAADGRDVKAVDPDAGNISMSLSFEDAATGERIFNGLAAGGKVGMPINAAFWAAASACSPTSSAPNGCACCRNKSGPVRRSTAAVTGPPFIFFERGSRERRRPADNFASP